MTTEATIPVNCGRCGGSGRYGPLQVQNGVCFKCGGAGIVGYTTQAEIDRKAREAARRQKARERAATRKRAKIEAKVEATLAQDPELKAALHDTRNSKIRIVADIASRFFSKGEISDKQHAVVLKIAKQEAEREATEQQRKAGLTNLEAGKQEITGTILSFKDVESQYGITTKMLLQLDNGSRLFGTCPRSLLQVERGSKVTFTATVEPKEKGFGFFSRPTKACLVG